MKLEILSDLSNIASTSALRKEVSDMSQFIALYYAKWFLTSISAILHQGKTWMPSLK